MKGIQEHFVVIGILDIFGWAGGVDMTWTECGKRDTA